MTSWTDSRQADTRRHRRPLGRPVGRRWHLPLRHVGRTGRRLLHRHPAPDRQRLAAHGARVQLHPHRLDRPLPADGAASGVLSDGMGRQRPADRAPRAELTTACAATRPSPTTETSSHRSAATHRRSIRRCRSRDRTSSNSATNSSRSTRRCSKRCTDASGCSVDWSLHYATIDERSRRVEPTRLPAQRRTRRGVQPGSPDPVGHRLPHRRRPGRDRGPRAVPARTTRSRSQKTDGAAHRDRHDPPRTARRLRRARGAPRRRTVPAVLRHRR